MKSEKPEPKALSVTQVVRRMKNLLEIQLGEVWVEGEISNLRKQVSGHWYFTLKDEGAQLSCAMFGARKREGSVVMEDGVKVRAFGEPSVYEARGQLQMVVQRVEPAGVGELQARFEWLKRKLQAEGCFEESRKRKLPKYPGVVGIVTSESGAAIRDLLQVLGRRAPWVKPVLYPVQVQGKGAEFGIARAIERMGEPEKWGIPRCDVLIVGRGGGSLEDLWNFNEEVVARAILGCPVPVISAVGHEIDFTIADFVADLRAPTPSAAAELAVPDREDLMRRVETYRRRLAQRVGERVERYGLVLANLRRGVLAQGGDKALREPEQRLDGLRQRLDGVVVRTMEGARGRLQELSRVLAMHRPERQLALRAEGLERFRQQMERAVGRGMRERERAVERLAGLLRALGPESAFERGFSILLGEDGRVIRSAEELAVGDRLNARLKGGQVEVVVEQVREG